MEAVEENSCPLGTADSPRPKRGFVFAYVGIFSLYRPDIRTELEAGEIGGFTVDQAFLRGITLVAG
jgi:hypothetical protein